MEGDFEPRRINGGGGGWVVDPLGFVAVKHLIRFGFVLFFKHR